MTSISGEECLHGERQDKQRAQFPAGIAPYAGYLKRAKVRQRNGSPGLNAASSLGIAWAHFTREVPGSRATDAFTLWTRRKALAAGAALVVPCVLDKGRLMGGQFKLADPDFACFPAQ